MTTDVRWPRAAEAITAAVAKPIQKVRDRFTQGETVITPAAEAWRLWRHVGELHYATTFMARQVSRLAWDVIINGEKLERPENKPWPAVLDAATFPTGVRNITQQMTLNYLVPGAFYYLQDPFNVWEVAATTRPKLNELLEASAHAIHAINPDPEQPGRPDSPVLANLDTIRELVLLQALQRSQSRLRIAQRGVLLYPAEAEFAEGINFEEDFQNAATEPIKDEFAASAVSPLILKFPEALIEKWRHLVLESPYDEELTAKIESVTRRLAIGLDMPPEALLGMGDATHWTVWNVSESTYRAHMEPWAVDVGKVLARAIHRIRGDEAEVEVVPDPTPVLAKLGSVTDAFEAFDRGIVNEKYVRELMGADADDAPDDDDLTFMDPAQMPPRIRRLSSDRTGPPAERPALPGQTRPSSPGLARSNGGPTPVMGDGETEESKELAEIVQKVYLGVTNGVVSVAEARQLLRRAGWTDLSENLSGDPEEAPEETEDVS